MVLWGIERYLDEHLWLGEDGHLGSILVQLAGVALAIAGLVLLSTRIGPYRRWRDTRPDPVPPAPDGDGGGADAVGDDASDAAPDGVGQPAAAVGGSTEGD